MTRVYDSAGEKNPNYRHGLTNGKKYRHPIYTTWQNMRSRCFNENNLKYHRYGGRGITVCSDWLNIINFLNWSISNGWQFELTIDRIDNNGHYEPNNCQWISRPKNSRKKSTTKLTIELANEIRKRVANGEDEHLLASEFKVSHGTVWFIVCNKTWQPQ